MSDREEFEKWFAATRPSKHRPNFALREDGTYVDDHTQRHWWTWQNAVLAERERCAKVCESQEVHDVGHPGTAFAVQGMCIAAIRGVKT